MRNDRKFFRFRIEIDVHSVDSRETSLRRFEDVVLRVHALDSTAVTMPAYPSFPIHFREKLIFEKVMGVTSLTEIQHHLSEESLYMELVQWSSTAPANAVVIARFRSTLSDFLFPELDCGAGDSTLTMEPCEKLPEITGLRVDVSTKTIIEETARPAHDRDIHSSREEVGHCCRHEESHFWKRYPTDICRKPKTREKRDAHLIWSQPLGITSSSHCCICCCYSDYFDPKPIHDIKSRSSLRLKNWFKSDDIAKPYRQFFYENFDFFYRQLCDMKKNRSKF